VANIVKDGARILGTEHFDQEKHGWPVEKYIGWGTLLDCRGDLSIHKTVRVGYEVAIITASHLYDKEGMGRRFLRKVQIDEHAWVGTRALLYNCWVQEHAIVGAGSVVKNVVVPAWSIVEGSPAVIIGRFDAGSSRYVKFLNGYTEEMEKF